jgi:2'-5' RNA ligase
MQENESIRCFVAIELPSEVKQSLAETGALLRTRLHAPVKWVEPDAIHLTLKFLGGVPASKLDQLNSAIERACSRAPALTLRAVSVGAFPSVRSPRVIWVGMAGDTGALALLAGRIDEEMAGLGFARESRPFAAHLTLGRVREEANAAERSSICAALQAVPEPECPVFTVRDVSLMQSHLAPQGARYTCLGRTALAGHLAS